MSNLLNDTVVSTYQNSTPQSRDKRKRPEHEKDKVRKRRHREENTLVIASDDFSVTPKISTIKFADIGGLESVLQDIRELIEYPLRHPEIYAHLGVEPARGVLIHGPAGCGKTMLAQAIGGEFDLPFFSVSAPELVSGVSGESESKIRTVFSEAMKAAPSIIFIDEVDAITPKRDTAQREMERRIVAQLISCMDSLSLERKHVVVLGATNRVDAIDPGLRRAGRFDREIALGVPDLRSKERILQVVTRRLRVDEEIDYGRIAQATPGYVGADLVALAQEAATLAVHRIFTLMNANENMNSNSIESEDLTEDTHMEIEKTNPQITKPISFISAINNDSLPIERSVSAPAKHFLLEERELTSRQMKQRKGLTEEELSKFVITMDDFLNSVSRVQPSVQREGFNTKPNVRWDDVGALDDVREEMMKAIVGPVNYPSEFSKAGLSSPTGILLYGPPGCGKTLIAKAVAGECGANFIGIKGPQLLNKYVGEAERAVRQLFQRAQSSSPCIIFFDEIDALCAHRSDNDSSGSARLVNQLLTEMDGLESREGVFVVAATNRPNMIDRAMLRPGRLDMKIPVGLPTEKGRENILEAVIHTKAYRLCNELNLSEIAKRTNGFSGADLAALLKEAAMLALVKGLKEKGVQLNRAPNKEERERLTETKQYLVTKECIDEALTKLKPSVSKEDEKKCLYFELAED